MLAGFPFLKHMFLSGSLSPREVRRRELDSREPLTFTLGLFLCPLPLSAAAPEAGFSSCLSREEKCFSQFSAPSVETNFFVKKFGVVSRFTLLSSILHVLRPVLTVEADRNCCYPEFLRVVSSSSG